MRKSYPPNHGSRSGEGDIFPEEFPNFLSFPEPARIALFKRHGDLFDPEVLAGRSGKLRAGDPPEIPPYTDARRLVLGNSETDVTP